MMTLPVSGPDPELLVWLALRRVRSGGVAETGGYYFDRGLPVPGYLADPLLELTEDGLVALADADPAGLRRASITSTGQARYSDQREQFRQRDASARATPSI